MTRATIDTSAAVPYVQQSHEAHQAVSAHLHGWDLRLTGHSLAETYAVLTRLPGDARVAPGDAAQLLEQNFGATVLLPSPTASALPAVLARAGVAGGAVYDALVALAAKEANLPLVTRDARAAATYSRLGVTVEMISSP